MFVKSVGDRPTTRRAVGDQHAIPNYKLVRLQCRCLRSFAQNMIAYNLTRIRPDRSCCRAVCDDVIVERRPSFAFRYWYDRPAKYGVAISHTPLGLSARRINIVVAELLTIECGFGSSIRVVARGNYTTCFATAP